MCVVQYAYVTLRNPHPAVVRFIARRGAPGIKWPLPGNFRWKHWWKVLIFGSSRVHGEDKSLWQTVHNCGGPFLRDMLKCFWCTACEARTSAYKSQKGNQWLPILWRKCNWPGPSYPLMFEGAQPKHSVGGLRRDAPPHPIQSGIHWRSSPVQCSTQHWLEGHR